MSRSLLLTCLALALLLPSTASANWGLNWGSLEWGPDGDADGLSSTEELALGTDPSNPDTDGDGVSDGPETAGGTLTAGPDNCPFLLNAGQENSDPFSAGDVCQCGDVDNDGSVTALDLTIVRENVVGATLSGNLVPDRCDYRGDAGCGVDDAFILARLYAGENSIYENSCPAYGAP